MYKLMKILGLLSLVVGISTGCGSDEIEAPNEKLKVAVGILPLKGMVETIGGDYVEVVAMIPPGASETNYQPSPKEMSALSDSKLYFSLDIASELANIVPILPSQMKVVDLADAVDEVYPARFFEEDQEAMELMESDKDSSEAPSNTENSEGGSDHTEDEEAHDHDHAGRDPHVWMSPKRAMVMLDAITTALSQADPIHEDDYRLAAQKAIELLEDKDRAFISATKTLTNKSFIIMHPALGYLADDYGLNMVALEEDGKESGAARLLSIIDYAREQNIKVVFYQQEFDSTQAKTLADEIGGQAVPIEPLSPDYFDNLDRILEAFVLALN